MSITLALRLVKETDIELDMQYKKGFRRFCMRKLEHTFLPPTYVACPLYPSFLEALCREVAVVVLVLVG